MTDDEMRTLLREELGTVVGTVKNYIDTALNSLKGEVMAAIQATNQRIDSLEKRVDQVQQNVLELKGNVTLLDQKVDRLDHKVNELEGRVGALERKVDALDSRVGQMAEVLDEATVKIADLQQSTFNLENKVDTYHASLKQEITRSNTAIQGLGQQVFDLNQRLTNHIATPWNKAHPDPNSAA